jgi:hypothetical protein
MIIGIGMRARRHGRGLALFPVTGSRAGLVIGGSDRGGRRIYLGGLA